MNIFSLTDIRWWRKKSDKLASVTTLDNSI